MNNAKKKSASLILVILILAIILSLISPMLYAYASIGNNFSTDSSSKQVLSSEKKLETLSEAEKKNIDFLFNVQTSKNDSSAVTKMADNIEFLGTERYLTIKDFDGDPKYLYAEYLAGGYAVYDRIAEFMYESSKYGCGPFDDYVSGDYLYYGGPTYFYINTSDTYRHVVTDEVLTESDTQNLSDNLNEVREGYIQGENDELSLSATSTRAATKMFNLGENIKDSQATLKEDAMWYYPSLALSHQYNSNKDTLKCYEISSPELNYKDAYFGMNDYGSCAFVALSSVMLYYDRIDKAHMVPDDISSFELMYDYGVSFQSDIYANSLSYNAEKKRYIGNLSDIPKNDMKSEFLHQKLLYNTFPEHRNKSTIQFTPTTFGYSSKNLGSVYSTFASQYQLNNYTYTYRTSTSYLPEAIVAGNPCIVRLTGLFPYSSPGGSHAVVAYAFEGTHTLFWYTIDSIYCNYGWMNYISSTESYSSVKVNKNFIDGYGKFNIF